MYYPGDLIPFLLSLTHVDGSAVNVTTPPQVSVLNTFDNTPQVLAPVNQTSLAMSLVPGTDGLYKLLWNTAGIVNGTYLVLVSYVADGSTITGRLLSQVQLGDTRIAGIVAQDATVAKDVTVAKDATVMHLADFVQPINDPAIQDIRGRIQALPVSGVADAATLAAVQQAVNDCHDAQLGSWTVDKTGNTMSLYRLDGTLLQQFSLSNTTTLAARTALVMGLISSSPGGRLPASVYGTAAPTAGTWIQGDTIVNLNPVAGGYVGWICVVGGTPGTWSTYGIIGS